MSFLNLEVSFIALIDYRSIIVGEEEKVKTEKFHPHKLVHPLPL